MLTAILNGKKILAANPAWDGRKEEYRALCNNQAICPICQEQIICKFGAINQHHFAHRRNNDCPSNHDTEEHMTGKTILYNFLTARYGQDAEIDLEHHIPELKTTCDLMVEFHDGRRWAVEFYCGGKEQDLRDKIGYYEDQNIETTWLLSPSVYRKHISGKAVKIFIRERLLMNDTGIDKLYIGDWYEQVVVKRQIIQLPRDRDSWGSLVYFDVEQKELKILRALKPSTHTNIYYYGALLQGPLDEIVIRFTDNWGIIWYFEQEKELKSKYLEAKKVLKELPVIELSKKIDNVPKHAEYEKKEYAPLNLKNKGSVPTNNSPYPSGWNVKDFEPQITRYRCTICHNKYDQNEMSIIPHLNIPEGKCKGCFRKKDLEKGSCL